MKIWAGIWILSTLIAAAALAEDTDRGEPVLPREALEAALEARSAAFEDDLVKVSGVHWEEDDPSFLEDASAPVLPGFSASLRTEPATRPLPGAPSPRDCGDVLRERRQVRAWIAQTSSLRERIEALDRRIGRACRRDPRCDVSPLDAPLAQLKALLVQLRAYADRELNAPADRLLVYRFGFDDAFGRSLLREGWRPVGAGSVVRVRYYRSPWDSGPEFGFGLEGRLTAPPEAQPDGSWLMTRALTATHACANGQVFRVEFRAGLERVQGELRAARTELVRAISR